MSRLSHRALAKANGKPKYKGQVCKHCDTNVRYTVNAGCVKCTQREAANARMRERHRKLANLDLPTKNASARTRAKARRLDRYKGRACKQCGSRDRDIETMKCLACAKAGVTYYSRVVRPKTDLRVRLLNSAKARAKQFGRDFNLTLDDIIIPQTCPVLGTPMVSPSLDRHNNDLGYVKGNVFVISKRANMLKSNGSAEDFKKIIAYLENPPKITKNP